MSKDARWSWVVNATSASLILGKNPGTPCTGGGVDLRAGYGEENIFCFHRR